MTDSNIAGMKAQIVELMRAAVTNDNTAWEQVNDACNLAATIPAEPNNAQDLIDALTDICTLSFELRAANSASLARFLAFNTMGLKIAVSGKKKTVKIVVKQGAAVVGFIPTGDWAHFKAPNKDKKSFEQKVIAAMKTEMGREGGMSASDMKAIDWKALIDAANK